MKSSGNSSQVILVVEALTTIGNTNKGLNSSIACDGYDNYKIPPIAGQEFWNMIHLEYDHEFAELFAK
jgi:hypothetical protein